MFRTNFTVKLQLKGEKNGIFSRVFLKKTVEKEIVLSYQVANIIETFEFLELLDRPEMELLDFIFDFFDKFGDKKLSKKVFGKYVLNNIITIVTLLRKTRFRGVFGVITIEDEEKQETDEKQDLKRELSKLVALMSQKMSLDPAEITKKYSFEELNYWADFYNYLDRAGTEDGQIENTRLDNEARFSKNRSYYDSLFGELDKVYIDNNK